MILIVEEPIIFEFEVRLSTQRLMFESFHNFRMVKLRRNKLKLYATFLRLRKGFAHNRNWI